MRGKTITAEDRFWCLVVVVESCWEWVGHRDAAGYGKFWFDGRATSPHRWAYEHFRGSVPAGLELDHLCRNRGCVNPDHLEPVTSRENTLRGAGAPAANHKKTVCHNGHPLDGRNVISTPSMNGRRRCRTCMNAVQRRMYHKRRALGLPRKGTK